MRLLDRRGWRRRSRAPARRGWTRPARPRRLPVLVPTLQPWSATSSTCGPAPRVVIVKG